jgi:hypothetical protein
MPHLQRLTVTIPYPRRVSVMRWANEVDGGPTRLAAGDVTSYAAFAG